MSDEPKPQLAKQLREFQSKIKPLRKEGINPHYKSTFAKHEDVYEYFLPILTGCGLSLHQDGKEHNDMFYLETVLENDFDEKRVSVWPVCKSDLDVQKKCAAVTYISRHAAMRMLGLSATDDDDDGNDAIISQETPTHSIIPKGTTHILDEKGMHKKEDYSPPSGPTVLIEALVSYDERNKAKTAGFKFDKESKRWLKEIDQSDARQYPFEVREV